MFYSFFNLRVPRLKWLYLKNWVMYFITCTLWMNQCLLIIFINILKQPIINLKKITMYYIILKKIINSFFIRIPCSPNSKFCPVSRKCCEMLAFKIIGTCHLSNQFKIDIYRNYSCSFYDNLCLISRKFTQKLNLIYV